mmetsp:Transcript_23917/g.43854  ORF Transcript_23917/g.43854 Transcript_23917/m.43854 type:complete len:743 (+) Transcript_23917:44-2272(+)
MRRHRSPSSSPNAKRAKKVDDVDAWQELAAWVSLAHGEKRADGTIARLCKKALPVADLARASGFFAACPDFAESPHELASSECSSEAESHHKGADEEDSECKISIASAMAMIPSSARLSDLAWQVLPLALVWVAGSQLAVFADSKREELAVIARLVGSEKQARLAVALLELGRFLLCSSLQSYSMIYVERCSDAEILEFVAALLGIGSVNVEDGGGQEPQYSLTDFLSEATSEGRFKTAKGIRLLLVERCHETAECPAQARAALHLPSLVLPSLLVMLQDEHAPVRAAAAAALGTAGRTALDHAEQLGVLLVDESPSVRAACARALGSLGPQPGVLVFVEQIAALLSDPSKDVATAAVESLSALGHAASLPIIAELQRGDRRAQKAASQALGSMGQAVVAHVLPLLNGSKADVQRTALEVLGAIGGPGVACHVDAVVPLMQHSASRIRAAAVATLGVLERDVAETYIEDILALLSDDQANVRRAAVGALGSLGTTAVPYSAEVITLLSDDDWSVRQSAVHALKRLPASATSPHIAKVGILLSDEVPNVQEAALQFIGELAADGGVDGAAAAAHTRSVVALLDDEDNHVHIAAVAAFKSLLTGGTREVREAAAAAFADTWNPVDSYAFSQKVCNSVTSELCVLALSDEDRHVREETARALVCVLNAKPDSDRALSAILELLGDVSWNVRRAAAASLTTSTNPNVVVKLVDKLVKLVQDPVLSVRKAASETLKRWKNLGHTNKQ